MTMQPNRRDFLVMGAGIFTVSALGIGAAQRRVVRRNVPVMGTVADIAVVTRDERAAQRALQAAVDELYLVERTMSRFTSTSDIGRANLCAHAEPIVITAATAHVVRAALRWADTDGSAFDPALGRVAELWDINHRSAPPAAPRVHALAGRRLHRSVELIEHGNVMSLRYHDADVALDLGGIAKGYAVDRAVAALRAWGVRAALVNVGGDLYALGSSADGDPWQVGIRSPSDPAALVATLALADRAIATSGDYEQFFEHAGRRYHHLLDPATAMPRLSTTHSLSIAADTCMDADAGATAVFGLPLQAAQRVLQRVAPAAVIAHHV